MAEDTIGEVTTQTQTQNSQVDWSQTNTPSVIPAIIWGRLYSTKHSITDKNCWRNISQNQEYCDLIQPDFTLGRSVDCSFVMKKDIIKGDIIKNVSKKHFAIRRDLSEPLSPAVIVDLSYNGTFVNGEKIGKGNSRVLDDRDEIAITHPSVKIFCFKDLLKNEQDNVPKQISQKYYISRTLGQGACGIVKLVFDKKKMLRYAMKIVKKNRLTNGQLNNLTTAEKIMNEVYIMKSLRHPCIVSTEEVFNCPDAVYIVLELMQGGELFDRISKQGRLSERLTRFMFRQIVLAVRYLHSRGITHRDLKPENVLLESKEDDTLIKITDFGLSKFVGEDTFMRTMCGTPLYLAPEVLRANGQLCYGPEVDVWSLGVIFFICLVGYLPFSADYKDMTLREQILCGRYWRSQAHWRDVTPQARALMRRMLDVNVQRRITLDQILDHDWMQDADIIIRVERLLSQSMWAMESGSLLMDSSDQETYSDAVSIADQENNNNSSGVSVVSIVAKTKRALSDSSSCEPMSKKLKLTLLPDNTDTSSASLYSSES